MIVVSRAFEACITIRNILVKYSGVFALAALIRSLLREMSSASVIIILWINQSRIQSIIRQCSSFLRKEDKRNVLRLTTILLLTKLTVVTGVVVTDFALRLYKQTLRGEPIVWIETSRLFGQYNSWEFVIFSVYVTLVKVIHAAELSAYTSFVSTNCLNSKVVFRHISRFMWLKDEAMRSLSIIP